MTTTTPRPTPQSATHQRRTKAKGSARQRIAFAIGNLGQAAFYNAMSTFFMTYTRPRCSHEPTRRSPHA